MVDFLSQIIDRTRQEKQKLAAAIASGINVNTFDDYQRLIGRHEGFQAVLDIIDELLTEDEEL